MRVTPLTTAAAQCYRIDKLATNKLAAISQ
jgi:hypothetical protein